MEFLSSDWSRQFLVTFTAIFVAIDAIGIVPLFMSLTSHLEKNERRQTVRKSITVAFVVAVVFMLSGTHVFRLMGISVPDFRIAGGIVLLLVSLSDLLRGHQGTVPITGSTGVVPLAVPLITGPGVITAVVLQVQTAGYLLTAICVVLNFAFAWFVLSRAQKVADFIGKDGTVVVSKIAALLLAALAVAMIRSGVVEIIKGA